MVLKHEINTFRRSYFIEKVNEPLLRALQVAGITKSFLSVIVALIGIAWDIKKYPTPTLENVRHHNSLLVLETYQEYIKLERFERIKIAVWFLIRVWVVKNEHSPNYSDRSSWWMEKLSQNWRGRSLNHPRNGWAEQRPYGGR